MIIARLEYDILALKACAATSFSWYNIAFPLIHHTFIFRDRSKTTSRACLNPLFPMHKLGLLPFVKKAQFHKEDYAPHWVVPAIFDPQSMRYFRALVNLQDLAIEALDLSLFPPEPVGAFFGHFSPTLRSLALMCPLGSRRRLLDFFRLFPKLDDIMICEYFGEGEDHEVLDGKLIPIEGGLRGQLKLKNVGDEGLLKDMIVAFGGMRFTSVCLESVQWAVPLLLKACAGTLQTVYIYPGDGSHIGKTILVSGVHISNVTTDVTLSVTPLLIDLSHCTVLRSLEIPSHSFPPLASNCAYMIRALSTITSPVFSEIVVVFENGGRWQGELADVLAEMYNVKQFRVRFCLQAPERSRADFLPRLASYTRAEIAEGTYDFLPCPPLIFSRPVSNFDHLYQNVQGWHAP